MDRPDDILIPADTGWLTDPAAQAVCAAISAGGHDVHFVGGCVRNALLGEPASDVDLSTDAKPEVVMSIAQDAGLRAIPTGIDHGTVTVVVSDKAFEVTTYRRDVATDGRRAVVAFSNDIMDDAKRRDFTMNALYATPEGHVIDPLGGLDDLRARRVRFILDPAARIREDYLRILRFFRFSARYADPNQGFDADALAAISANIDGLETLSAERIGQEMAKLLSVDDPARAIAVMRQTNVLGTILPGADDRWLGPMAHLEQRCDIAPDWRARLAMIGGQDVAERLRLSKADGRYLALLREVGFAGPSISEIAYRHGSEVAWQALIIRHAISETMPSSSLSDTICAAANAHFPIEAGDLMPQFTGPELGARLRTLEQRWIESGFALSRDALLSLP